MENISVANSRINCTNIIMVYFIVVVVVVVVVVILLLLLLLLLLLFVVVVVVVVVVAVIVVEVEVIVILVPAEVNGCGSSGSSSVSSIIKYSTTIVGVRVGSSYYNSSAGSNSIHCYTIVLHTLWLPPAHNSYIFIRDSTKHTCP